MKGKPIWNLYKEGELLGVYTTEEVSQITGMRVNNVSNYGETGFLYKGIYRIEREEDFSKRWADATGVLLGRKKDKKQVSFSK